MKLNIKYFFATALLLVSMFAQAATSPVDMLQSATNQMISALENTSNRNTQSLYSLVRKILLPHVDLDLMSQQVTGAAWAKATPEQRNQFKQQFTFYVTRTYSSALSSYTNQKVKFYPIRGGVSGNRAQVNSAIIQQNGDNIAVSYRVIQSGGEWKVYDFSVEGVSMVDNYRSQFADVLRSQGLGGLIQSLSKRNEGIK